MTAFPSCFENSLMSACCSLMLQSCFNSWLHTASCVWNNFIVHLLQSHDSCQRNVFTDECTSSELMRCHSGFILRHPEHSGPACDPVSSGSGSGGAASGAAGGRWEDAGPSDPCRGPLPGEDLRRLEEPWSKLNTHTHLQPWPKESVSRCFCRPACSSHTKRRSERSSFCTKKNSLSLSFLRG